jgi:hypothetical protein
MHFILIPEENGSARDTPGWWDALKKERGKDDGHELDDWLQAESELKEGEGVPA